VRRCAERKRAQHAAELRLKNVFGIASNRKSFLHHIWAVIADRP
jgi:hypothetical protein